MKERMSNSRSFHKYSTRKVEQLPLTSGYFNREPHGPTKGYVQEPAVAFIQKQRITSNQDFKDKQILIKLYQESTSPYAELLLKELENENP